jgi:hypothetical protein
VVVSAVPGDAVAEPLVPILAVGLFCCATAVARGAAIIAAAKRSERDFENITMSFRRSRVNIPGGIEGNVQGPFRFCSARKLDRGGLRSRVQGTCAGLLGGTAKGERSKPAEIQRRR